MALALAVAGCGTGAMIDSMPSSIGLPAGTPERPAAPYQYPAVHDMPPPRPVPIMTEEQQLSLEKELTVARERQAASEGTAKKTAQTAKKKKPAAAATQAGGSTANP